MKLKECLKLDPTKHRTLFTIPGYLKIYCTLYYQGCPFWKQPGLFWASSHLQREGGLPLPPVSPAETHEF